MGAGASISGGRAMVCMKHVGLNVAADPLFTVAYTGVNGGLVIVVADDPAMHSSQNEQDSRFMPAAHIPMLEPADSDEALRFTRMAFDLSEQYDTPVLIRTTTRVAHSQSVVRSMGERREVALKPYVKDIAKYVMMPAQAKGRHVAVEARENCLQAGRQHPVHQPADPQGRSAGRHLLRRGVSVCHRGAARGLGAQLGMVYPRPWT